jgi:PAS domain S-box-containing protein
VDDSTRETHALTFLNVAGHMAGLMRAHDWASTPLGPAADWPLPLKTLVGLMLSSTQPMFMAWGDEGTWLYNDAFIPILGSKHPQALGRPALDEVWSEARDALAPLFDEVFVGKPVQMDDFALMLDRRGKLEEAHFSFFYTPARDQFGRVVGLLGACTEITERVLAEQRRVDDQERRRRQFEQAPGLIVITRGPQHVIEFANNAHRQLFKSDDWIGKTVRGALPSLTDHSFFDLLDQVYQTGETYTARGAMVQYRIAPDLEEETRYMDFIYAPLVDEHGVTTGLFCEGFDVTEVRKTQKQLRASQDELRRLNETLLRSEQMLRERENELARVQQIAKVGGTTVDLQDGVHSARRSPEYLALHGLPPDALDTHEAWINRLHPEDRDRVLQQFLNAANGTSAHYSSEYRIVRPNDGEVRWIAVEARIERAPDGRPLRMIGAHIDITDRALAREMLRESEERFRLIANSAPVPMWVSRIDGQRSFANQAYLDFLGLSYEEALVFDWRKVLHPDDLARILQEQVTGEGSHKPFVLEARYRRADGQWRWMHSESQPRWDPTGKQIGFIGVAHDITVAKQAESELRRLNETLSVQVARRTQERDRIWNVSKDLLLVLDQQGNWLSANPAWNAATGWAEDDVLSWRKLGAQHETLRRACSELTLLLLAGRTNHFDVQIPHSNGSYRWISWTSTMDDDLIYAVGRDVTAERDAQEALRKTEEALRQSQKLEAMGQLTGGVAHDFNNLLMPIIGSLDLLQRRGVGGEREQRLIGGALQSADRAKTLVQRLLAFARRQPLRPVAVNVAELVGGMAELIGSTTGPQIMVAVDVAPDSPLASADPNQLEMAILNLCVNARDAMPHGGILRVSVAPAIVVAGHHSKLPPGRYARMSVADNGTGMSEEVLAHAIEPFFSTKGVGKGTGLGLSMAHGLATQLGGALTIASKVGVGTNVELWLPVCEHVADPELMPPEVGPAAAAVGIALLVDDDDMVRMSTADMLAELGFAVMEADSGESALTLVDKGLPFDVLVTDHLMPGMSGVDLAYAVRARRPNTPVLLISGFAEAEGIASDLPRLMKPFRQAELAASVAIAMPQSQR